MLCSNFLSTALNWWLSMASVYCLVKALVTPEISNVKFFFYLFFPDKHFDKLFSDLSSYVSKEMYVGLLQLKTNRIPAAPAGDKLDKE